MTLAKPLITSSEETAARHCRAFDDTPERLIQSCTQALRDGAPTAAERAVLLTLQGDALDLLDRVEEAEEAFSAAAEADPGHVRAHTGMGWLLWNNDREAEAVVHFRRAVDLRPTADGLGGLGSSLYRSGQGSAEEALALIDAALAIEPEYVWALRERGWIALDEGETDTALDAFDAALALARNDWNAHYGRSRTLAQAEQYGPALEAIAASIASDPSRYWTYAHRAFVLRRLDRNAQAITEAQRAVSMAPGWPGGYVQLALAQESLGRRAEAITTFAEALQQGAENAYLLHWYADVLSNDGQMDRAAEVIDRAVARADGDQYDLSLKAYIAVELKDYETALAAAEQALALDGTMPYPHYLSLIHI